MPFNGNSWQHPQELECRPGKRKRPKVILERDGVLLLYKPPHWTMTTTAAMPRARSIQAWLCDNVGHRYPFIRQDPLQAGLVQRLDVETSGLVVVATRQKTFRQVWQMRSAGQFYREYSVLLHGLIPLKHCFGTLNYALRTDRWSTRVCERHGLPATTRYQATGAFLRHWDSADEGRRTSYYTLVRARIFTGRTHQIRVHLRELARELQLGICGVVGDYRYLPRSAVELDKNFCPRVFLHAKVLRFPIPGARAHICAARCELPADLSEVLEALTPDREMTAKFQRIADTLAHGAKLEVALPSEQVCDEEEIAEFRGYGRVDGYDEEDHDGFAGYNGWGSWADFNRRANTYSHDDEARTRSPSHWSPNEVSDGPELLGERSPSPAPPPPGCPRTQRGEESGQAPGQRPAGALREVRRRLRSAASAAGHQRLVLSGSAAALTEQELLEALREKARADRRAERRKRRVLEQHSKYLSGNLTKRRRRTVVSAAHLPEFQARAAQVAEPRARKRRSPSHWRPSPKRGADVHAKKKKKKRILLAAVGAEEMPPLYALTPPPTSRVANLERPSPAPCSAPSGLADRRAARREDESKRIRHRRQKEEHQRRRIAVKLAIRAADMVRGDAEGAVEEIPISDPADLFGVGIESGDMLEPHGGSQEEEQGKAQAPPGDCPPDGRFLPQHSEDPAGLWPTTSSALGGVRGNRKVERRRKHCAWRARGRPHSSGDPAQEEELLQARDELQAAMANLRHRGHRRRSRDGGREVPLAAALLPAAAAAAEEFPQLARRAAKTLREWRVARSLEPQLADRQEGTRADEPSSSLRAWNEPDLPRARTKSEVPQLKGGCATVRTFKVIFRRRQAAFNTLRILEELEELDALELEAERRWRRQRRRRRQVAIAAAAGQPDGRCHRRARQGGFWADAEPGGHQAGDELVELVG